MISTNLIKHIAKKFTIVVFIDIEKRSYYESFFKDVDVIYEDLDTKSIDIKKKTTIFQFIHILKKFICGQNKDYKNKSIDVWKIKFNDEIKKKKFFLIYFLGFILRNSKLLKKPFFSYRKIY